MEYFKELRILIVDDDVEIHSIFSLLLKDLVHTIYQAQHPDEANEFIAIADIIFMDMNYHSSNRDGSEGLRFLQHIKNSHPKKICFCMTSYGEIELAVQAMQKGAIDFIEKPIRKERLIAALNSALGIFTANKQVDLYEAKVSEDNTGVQEFIGHSQAIENLKKTIHKVSKSDVSVLIRGENGTGKDLVAKHVHALSTRSHKPYIRVDMGAVSDSLFESEMFGHVKGSFTGANQNRYGRMELAHDGTLFLDEIGNLSLSSQAKLLRVLQDGEYYQVGSSTLKKLQTRVICATNMPLEDMIEEGSFRRDLFFRINTVELNVPRLKDHIEDIPLLCKTIVDRISQKYRTPTRTFSDKAIQQLKNYSWPGNIRELENVIERILVLNDDLIIEDHLLTLDTNKLSPLKQFDFQNATFQEFEYKLLKDRLNQFDGNISKVAKSLDLSRAAVYRRLEKHGLEC